MSPRGVVANVLDCNISVTEFKPLSRYYVHIPTNILEKGITPPPYSLAMLTSTPTIFLEVEIWH